MHPYVLYFSQQSKLPPRIVESVWRWAKRANADEGSKNNLSRIVRDVSVLLGVPAPPRVLHKGEKVSYQGVKGRVIGTLPDAAEVRFSNPPDTDWGRVVKARGGKLVIPIRLLESSGIAGAAIMVRGKVYGPANDHWDAYCLAADKGAFGKDISSENLLSLIDLDFFEDFDIKEGFVTKDGKYLSREEAMDLVRKSGVYPDTGKRDWLDSTDLDHSYVHESVDKLLETTTSVGFASFPIKPMQRLPKFVRSKLKKPTRTGQKVKLMNGRVGVISTLGNSYSLVRLLDSYGNPTLKEMRLSNTVLEVVPD